MQTHTLTQYLDFCNLTVEIARRYNLIILSVVLLLFVCCAHIYRLLSVKCCKRSLHLQALSVGTQMNMQLDIVLLILT